MPRRWIGLLFALLFLEDCALLVLGRHHHNNLWVIYLCNPLQVGLVLAAYAVWEVDARWRRALRFAVPAYFALSALLWMGAERTFEFSRYSGPLQSIVVVSAACLAIVRTAAAGVVPPWRTDVFWVSVGLLTYYGTAVLLEPVSAALVKDHPELVRTAFSIRAAISIVAFALVTVGLLCPSVPLNSGGS